MLLRFTIIKTYHEIDTFCRDILCSVKVITLLGENITSRSQHVDLELLSRVNSMKPWKKDWMILKVAWKWMIIKVPKDVICIRVGRLKPILSGIPGAKNML